MFVASSEIWLHLVVNIHDPSDPVLIVYLNVKQSDANVIVFGDISINESDKGARCQL